ncbi:hypothetical protein K3740_00310 [Ruegeria conchae]|uniref:hypothetical protein n=1 Tax=Ruegeria conchae TaxID=981384 RepID=UPI00147F508F|nr:hypothetical protein [Ruegeria conchae]UWR05094.1 hypothetical protein K3740_00310 [Ruegeria conchae]
MTTTASGSSTDMKISPIYHYLDDCMLRARSRTIPFRKSDDEVYQFGAFILKRPKIEAVFIYYTYHRVGRSGVKELSSANLTVWQV